MALTFADTYNMIAYLTKSDAKSIDCLPNEEIFTKLSMIRYEKPSTKLTLYKAFFSPQWKFLIHTILQCMSAKRTLWNEFSSSMASAVICLFTVGDLSSHSTKYSSPALTQKVFANMRKVGKGFSGVDTPFFEGMIVAQQADEGATKVNVDDVSAAGVANVGAASVVVDDVPAAIDEPFIPSPTPPTQPPLPSQDLPSTSQVQLTPPPSLIAQRPSPQKQPQSSQDADISMDLLHTLLETYTTITRRVEQLEQDKIAQTLEITKLKQWMKKLERRNKLKVSKLKRLKKVGTAQRVDTSKDTVMDDEVAVDAKIEESADVQGKQAESQAQIYQINLEHADKLMTEVVNAASATITAADTPILVATIAAASTLTTAPSAARRRKGVATPLALKVPVVDYEIYTENNKPYYKIKRAGGTHQLYLSFLSMLRNFDREDLEVLWKLVKESKGQKLETIRVLWCVDYNIHYNTVDLAGREKISTYKVYSDQMLNNPLFVHQLPSTTSPYLPPPSLLPSSSRKRSRSPSPPLPPLPSSLPSNMLPPHKKIQMTSPQTEATKETCEETTNATPNETIDPTSQARIESVDHTIPLLVAKLIRHKALIDEVQDHMREGSLVTSDRIKTLEQEAAINMGCPGPINNGDCSKRVTYAIAIYEMKIRVARDLMDRVVRQEAKVAKNCNNKRKWRVSRDKILASNKKRREVVKTHMAGIGNKKGYARKLPNCNKCKLHHNSLCTVKCNNYMKTGHMARGCRTPTLATAKRHQSRGNQKGKKGKARGDSGVIMGNAFT
nr:reverse transcriptase domain-containing protein [Tanacetum cinerariifolium]